MTDTDPTTEPVFDPKEVAKLARENVKNRASGVKEARERLAALEAFEADMATRAEEAHIRQAARVKEAADFREAQAKADREMDPRELAERVARNLRRP